MKYVSNTSYMLGIVLGHGTIEMEKIYTFSPFQEVIVLPNLFSQLFHPLCN